SLASEALEISSRRKISLWLYREWIMSCRSSRTCAWNSSVSRVLGVDMGPGRLLYRDSGGMGPAGRSFKPAKAAGAAGNADRRRASRPSRPTAAGILPRSDHAVDDLPMLGQLAARRRA